MPAGSVPQDMSAPQYESYGFTEPIDVKHEIENLPDYHQSDHAAIHHYSFALTEQCWKQNNYIFMSQDSIGKYKSFKDLGKDAPELSWKAVLELQHRGVGIPLLGGNVAYKENLKIGQTMTICRYKCPPQGLMFDKERDKEPFCEAVQTTSAQYKRYVFTFASGRTMTFFLHRRLPFGDVCFNKSESDARYRWLHSKYNTCNGSYRYDIERLQPDQPSMLDNMDRQANRLSAHNELVGSKLSAFGIPKRKILEDLKGGIPVGSIEYVRNYSWKSYARDAKMEFRVPMTLPDVDPESILSVDEETLELLCMGLVLHKRESDRRNQRRACYNYAGGS